MILDGRKIKREFENPFDNIVIDIAHAMNIYLFRPLGATPNIITTASLMFGLVAPWCFMTKKYIWAACMFFVAYLLDCADGNFARTYDMATPFGDYYDHISDSSKAVFMIGAIVCHGLSFHILIPFLLGFCILTYGALVHLGCQECMYHGDESKSLQFAKRMCPGKQYIIYTRYVGVGTLVLYILTFMMYLHMGKNISTSTHIFNKN